MKVAIIGHSPHEVAVAIARLEAKTGEKVELISIDEDQIPKRNELMREPLTLTNHRMIEPFYPKAKHLPKGYQRPYKFHP